MTEGSEDPRIADGLEHLRRAAREMIAASRALLDVAEEVVERPDAIGDLLELFGALGAQARRGARPDSGEPGWDAFLDQDPEDDDGVERIEVN